MQSPDIEPRFDAQQEYSTIEAALLETARGRWFLAEHSRRSRRLESLKLEGALDLLKASLRNPPALLGRLKSELATVQDMLQATRTELMAKERSDTTFVADDAPSPRTPVAGLLKAAEDLHELVWSLQAREIDPVVCEQIARQTAAIFVLTARQAQDSQRAVKLATALDAVAHRISGALETIAHEGTPEIQPA